MCFPPLVRSNFLILMNLLFFLPYFRRNSLFQWLIFFGSFLVEISNFGELFFPCVSPPYFNELFWSKFLVSVNELCFFVLGSVETIFSFFRILISVKTVRSFGAFFFSPLIPIEILGNFMSSPWFPSKFLFVFFFLPPFSRQNSVLIGNIIFSPLTPAKILFFSEIYCFPVLFKPKFDEIRFFFWRFICFPAFPWNFLIVAIYFFAALFSFIRVKTPYFGDLFVILYFSTLSFFPSIFGKNAEIIRNL